MANFRGSCSLVKRVFGTDELSKNLGGVISHEIDKIYQHCAVSVVWIFLDGKE